jgi:hypothetical protein
LIVRKASVFRLLEFERRQQITIEGFATWIASKEDLIIAKLDWAKDSHSELQLRDVRNLASTGYDADYLNQPDASARAGYVLEGVQAMTDTSPEVAAMIHDRIMSLTGSERFLMGIRMCEAARRMLLASLPQGLSEGERRRLQFSRVYGDEVPPLCVWETIAAERS